MTTTPKLIPLLTAVLAATATSTAQDISVQTEMRVRAVLTENLNGDADQALSKLDSLLAAKPSDAGPLLAARFRILRQTGRSEEAAETLKRMTTLKAEWSSFAEREGARLKLERPDLDVPVTGASDKIRELVRRLVDRSRDNGSGEAETLLLRIGSPAVPVILELFSGMDVSQQSIAVRVLMRIGDSQVVDWARSQFDDDGDEVVRGVVMEHLRYVRDPARQQIVYAAARCNSESVRRDALDQLSGPVPAELIPAVLERTRAIDSASAPAQADSALSLLVACPGNRQDVEAEILRLLPSSSMTTSVVSRGTATTQAVMQSGSERMLVAYLLDEGLTAEQTAARAVAMVAGRASLPAYAKAIDTADPDGKLKLRETLWARLGVEWRREVAQPFLKWAQENDRDEFALKILGDPYAGTMLWRRANIDLRKRSKDAARRFLETRQVDYAREMRQVLEDVTAFGWTDLTPVILPLVEMPDLVAAAESFLLKKAPVALLDHALKTQIPINQSYALRSAERRHLPIAMSTFSRAVAEKNDFHARNAHYAIDHLLRAEDLDDIIELVGLTTAPDAQNWSFGISDKVRELIQDRMSSEAVTRMLAIDGLLFSMKILLVEHAGPEHIDALVDRLRQEPFAGSQTWLVSRLVSIEPAAAERWLLEEVKKSKSAITYASQLQPGSEEFWKTVLDSYWGPVAFKAALASEAWQFEAIGDRILSDFVSDPDRNLHGPDMRRFLQSIEQDQADEACRALIKAATDRESIEQPDSAQEALETAIQWLGSQKDEEVIRDLTPLLDPELPVHFGTHLAAIRVAGQTYAPRAVPLLTEMLRSSNLKVRTSAEETLERMATYFESKRTWAERFRKLGIGPDGEPLPPEPSTPGPSGPKRNGR